MAKDQKEQAKPSGTAFALVEDGTLRVMLFTPEGTIIRNLDGQWMRRAEADEDIPTPDDLKEFRVALPEELSLLTSAALASLSS